MQKNTITTYYEFVDMIDETVSRLTFWHHEALPETIGKDLSSLPSNSCWNLLHTHTGL